MELLWNKPKQNMEGCKIRSFIILILLIFHESYGQNIISNHNFQFIDSSNSKPKNDFVNWGSIHHKMIELGLLVKDREIDPTEFYYAPPHFDAVISNICDFVNIYSNLEGEATNKFAILPLHGNYSTDGLYQSFSDPLKKGYYYFSLKVKQFYDTTGCTACKAPLEIYFSKAFTSPSPVFKRKLKKGVLIKIPFNEFGSASNPWIKYNFKVKLKGGEKFIHFANYTFSDDDISKHAYSDQFLPPSALYYVDDVILRPIKNKDTIFPSIEKKYLKPVNPGSIAIGKTYYFKEFKCFGAYSPSILGDSAICVLDSLCSMLIKNPSIKLTIVLPDEPKQDVEIVGMEILKYIHYFLEDKTRIAIEYRSKNSDIDITNINPMCPKSYWRKPRWNMTLFQFPVGFKFTYLPN